MRQWTTKLDADIHNVALGEAEGEVEIRNRATIEHATILCDVTKPAVMGTYVVPMLRFDRLFQNVARPAFCKIDVEGFEMSVLRGMTNTLPAIDVIVVESSLNTLYAGGVELADVVRFMTEHGFALFDVCEAKRRPFDSALHQLDVAFVKAESPMRAKRWS